MLHALPFTKLLLLVCCTGHPFTCTVQMMATQFHASCLPTSLQSPVSILEPCGEDSLSLAPLLILFSLYVLHSC